MQHNTMHVHLDVHAQLIATMHIILHKHMAIYIAWQWSPDLKVDHKQYSILLTLYSVQHWRSVATRAAALELPNLNYVQGLNWLWTIKPKGK